MSQQNLVEIAKQGDARAITQLINRSLNPKGINAKTVLREGCLKIMLESSPVPEREVADYVYRGISKLDIPEVNYLIVYGRQPEDEFPAWTEEFSFDEFDQLARLKPPSNFQLEQTTELPKAISVDRSTVATVKSASMAERLLMSIGSLVVFGFCGLFLLLIPFIGWVLGPICLLLAAGFAIAALTGDKDSFKNWTGKCPHCKKDLVVEFTKKDEICSHCGGEIVIKNRRFYAVEQ